MFVKKYPFKISESEQSFYVYRTNIDRKTKVKHISCQQLLCSTPIWSNMRPYCDNLIVKISCYDKDWAVVNSYSNVMMKLKCVIRFINQKKDYSAS